MLARWSQGRVDRGGYHDVQVGPAGEIPVLRVVVRPLDVLHARTDRDGSLEVGTLPGHAREVRGLLELRRGAFRVVGLDPANEVLGELGPLDELEERPLRVHARGHDLRLDAFAAGQLHADRAAIPHEDLADLRVRSDLHAEGSRGGCDRLADHPHAASDKPPRPEGTVHLAHVMMDQHVGRAGRPRAQERPDDPARTHGALEGVRLEPLVQIVGRGHRQEPREGVQGLFVDFLEGSPEFQHLLQVAGAHRGEVRRRHGELGLDEPRDLDHELPEPGVSLRVPSGELRDLPPVLLRVSASEEVSAVGEGRQGRFDRDDLVSVGGEVQVPDDLRPQQAADVGADGVLEPGEDLLRDRGAPEDMPPLQDEDLLACPAQVGRGDEAVVPSSDDDRIHARRHPPPSRARASGMREIHLTLRPVRAPVAARLKL